MACSPISSPLRVRSHGKAILGRGKARLDLVTRGQYTTLKPGEQIVIAL